MLIALVRSIKSLLFLFVYESTDRRGEDVAVDWILTWLSARRPLHSRAEIFGPKGFKQGSVMCFSIPLPKPAFGQRDSLERKYSYLPNSKFRSKVSSKFICSDHLFLKSVLFDENATALCGGMLFFSKPFFNIDFLFGKTVGVYRISGLKIE